MTTHEASSSSSSKSELWSYDVFLSFSGEDTRYGFTGYLHQALKDKGYRVFIDEDGLKRGEEIRGELLGAIEESKISIIVFSKRYADSSWCLDELVKIMECRDKLGRHVLPIFYHVDPSHIRNQNGDLAEAFREHEKDIHEETDDKKREAKQKRVKQWREALTEAGKLSGHHLKIANDRKWRREAHKEATNLSDHQTTGNGREAEFIKKIVDENIWEWLSRTNELHVAKHPIGIKSRIQGIISDLSSGGSNDVLMVGIWGMGGLGKTTAAKAIYNQIHRMFEFKSFLADVSDTSSKHGLVYLQETLISDILKQKSQIRSIDIGINMIQEVVQHRRVLIIIDNIDDRKQLDAIARSHDWFGPGSRIIMTTRNEHLLKQVEVDKTYPLREMKKEEALELFSWHAFQKSCPNEEYLEVSKKVVSYCGGLPLALEVLGSFLFKRPIKEWKCQLEKLERIPEGEIIIPLRTSFEGLDDTEKATFLDISCFFIGQDMDYVAKILDGCGFSATVGISVLRERCLITVEGNKLNMHDLLREMAKVIISEKSPDHPGKWSRLWNHKEITDVLTNKSGTRKIEGLALHFHRSVSSDILQNRKTVASFSTKAFAKMKKLRLLQLRNVELKGECKHLPKELIWLSWLQCPLKSMPDDFFNQPRLVVLEMPESKLVQVWEGSKSLHNLKTLDLSWSESLQKSPDFSQVPNLEELILKFCSKLSEIHPSIGHLERLSLVNLKGCSNLRSLPRDFYKLKSVETLIISSCELISELHEDIGEMISLRTLEAKHTAIKEVPPSIVGLKNLTRLSLDRISYVEHKGEYKHLPKELILLWEHCPLESIPDDFFNQDKLIVLQMPCSKLVQVWEGSKSLHNLKTLDLSRSGDLQKSPDFSQVPNLEELILEGCSSLSEIHPSIGHLKRLSLVNLTRCYKLHSLPRDFYKLKSVETLLLNYCSEFIEPHEDIGEMISLRTLEAEDTAIREVPPSIGHLKRLSLVNLRDCRKLTSLPKDFYKLKSVETLLLKGCSKFRELHEDIGEMISLRTLEAEDTAIREVPPSILGLENLTRLSLDRIRIELKGEYKYLFWEHCPLKSIDDFLNQDKLVVLKMHWSKLVQVWEGSKSLHNLKTLDLSCSCSLQKSPDFSQVPNLEELILERCYSLSEIHPSIGHLKRLSLVNLRDCCKLISLPRDFYKSKSVETLLLNRCSKFIELHEDIGEMISLRTLEAEDTAIREVPPSILGLENLTRSSLDRIRIELKGEYKYLFWEHCPLKSIDDFLNQDKLVLLKMHWSKLVQVWEGSKSLHNLKTLDLSCSRSLQKSPDFSQVPNLEELILERCFSLSEIHLSIGHLKRLSLVNLRDCCELISLPRDFYKSKSVETLLLNRCSKFIELHEDIGEMISLRTLEADWTAIREVPPSIVGLKNLTRLSLEGTMRGIQLPYSLREFDFTSCYAVPKDHGSLIYLQHLHLQGIMFHSLPNLSGLSKLETLWLNGSRHLRTIPDLPTNLKVLLANDCPALETMPNFSEMSNMRELDASDSAKLTEVPGLDKSLNSMAWIDMHGCPNLTVDFRKNILQGWTSCGFGGIALHGNYVPDWFEFVNEGTKVSFDIPPTDDRNLERLTLFCLFRVCRGKHLRHLDITVISNTKRTKLQAYKIGGGTMDENYEDDYLWQVQLSNNELNLQGGNKVDIVFEDPYANWNYSVKMMRMGVNLVWDKTYEGKYA